MSPPAPKRLIWALLALAAALALAACGGSDSDDSVSGETGEVFTTDAFQKTLDAVESDAGADAQLLRIRLTTAGTDYQIADGEQARGLHFAPGSSEPEDVAVESAGAGSVAESSFPISQVDPGAVDKMLRGAPEAGGVEIFKPKVMTLELGLGGEIGWTTDGDGDGGTSLVLEAAADGGSLEAPAEGDSTGIADCVRSAGDDVAKIQACATE